MLLGWTGSRIKSVAKYASIYSELGIPCVCVAPTLAEVWLERYGNAKAKNILRSMDDSLEEGCGVLLHLFSGASSTFLPAVVEKVANKETQLHISGVVFDSAPVLFSLRSGLAAAKLMKQQGGYGPLTYYASCAGGIVVNAIVGNKRRKSMRAALDHPVIQVPQLYLYSSIDTVALVDDVEDEIALQVSRGTDVSRYCWNGSQHVKHFIEYPEEYALQINKFLHKLNYFNQ